jgi:hypothetical protein
MTTGIPINPNYFNGLNYNSSFYNTSGNLTYAQALTKFLTFPIAQGSETFSNILVGDTLTASKNIIMNGATGASGNYIQFPDGTQQKTAPNTTNFASVNSSNTFLSQISPSQPYQQIITGNSLSGNSNPPLVVKNIDTGESFGFYIDPSTNYDATLYSAQTTGGLTLRNSAGNSFTMVPLNNTATFYNPISCDGFSLTASAITGSQLTLSSSGNSSVLTTSATGLNVNDPIVSTGSITGSQLTIANVNGVDTSVLTSTATGLNISDPIVSTGSITGTQLTLSSGGNSSIITTTGTGLAVNDSITISGGGTVTCDTLTATSFINTQTGDFFVGGESTFAKSSNLQGVSLSIAGLYIGRNLEVGQNEFDIIAYNPTSSTHLNIYGSNTTAISQASVPIISLANGTAYLNGNQIATTSQIVGSYSVGQIITGIFSTPPTNFLLCNGQQILTSSYPQLFALIGTAYNAYYSGVPSGYYALPNLSSGRFPLGSSTTITLNGKTIPSYTDVSNPNNAQGGNNFSSNVFAHSHTITTNSHSHGYGTGYSNVAVGSNSGTCATQTGGTPNYYSTQSVSVGGGTDVAGGNNISNISSFLAVNYFIYAGTP